MKRNSILQALSSYHPNDPSETEMVKETISFIQDNERCFENDLMIGHVTGSSWIVNPAKTHALLMHHQKLDKWFQPGGHCDGHYDVFLTAQREANEETGLIVKPMSMDIFDVDIHGIPAKGAMPAHKHYDIRFLFTATMDAEELSSNAEAKAIRWIKLDDVHRYNNSPSILRMVLKTK